MISAGDFKKGITLSWNNGLWQIVDFQHVKPGKGAAFVRAKLKNIVTGTTKEETFNPTEKFDLAHIETKDMQYLYNDGQLYYFMDPETYEQIPLNYHQVEEAIKYLKENDFAQMRFYQGGANKPATTETGAK